MSNNENFRMRTSISKLLVVSSSLVAASIPASAQGTLTEGQILQSLAGSGAAAAESGYDVEALRREIDQRIRVEGTENAASPPPTLQALSKLPNITVEVQFDFDSDWILPESWVTVAQMADALHHPLLLSSKFAIVGHTDAKGSREYNLELSNRRALSVMEMLEATFNVDPAMLVAVGFGEEQLRDPQNPDGGVNRRVQLINIGPR
jgi:outer membrane protein OmpA-like peptidoglycan-associated protein